MHVSWRHHVKTHVRSLVIVEFYELADLDLRLVNGLEVFPRIDEFCLHSPVHALCNAIISGVIVLCHADHDVVDLQFGDIHITAVLRASIRVMYDS